MIYHLRRPLEAAFIVIIAAGMLYPSDSPGAASEKATIEELQQEINKRDGTILELTRRVEALEQKLSTTGPIGQPATGADGTKPTQADTAEEETSRALERTLVRERAIVLPAWSIEIEPRYTYTYRATEGLRLTTAEGQPIIVQRPLQRDTSALTYELRLGLPGSSQFDFAVPYTFIRQESAASESRKRRHSGLGDLQLGWTKQLLQERGWWPDLLAVATWDSKTGGQQLGTGFNEVAAGMTAVKRRDPLAFFGTVSHIWSLSGRQGGNDFDAGNRLGFRLGAILATSPDSSLRFAFELSRAGKTEVNRRKINGSDVTVALLEIGASTTILRRTLLDVRAGVGLTTDSPDFRLGISLPVRLY